MALGRVFLSSVGRRLVTTTTGIVIGTAWVVQAAAPTGPTYPPMLRGASDRDALRFPRSPVSRPRAIRSPCRPRRAGQP